MDVHSSSGSRSQDSRSTSPSLFCGGTDLQPNQWMTNPNWNVAAFPADDTCVSITPDVSSEWVEEDSMFEGRCVSTLLLPCLRMRSCIDDPVFVLLGAWASSLSCQMEDCST